MQPHETLQEELSNHNTFADEDRRIHVDSGTESIYEQDSQITHNEPLSHLERTISRNCPILASLLLSLPTSAIFQLYHTSSFLRRLLQSSPLAWKYLSFRLYTPSAQVTNTNAAADGMGSARPSKNYALDQLLLRVVNPFSSNLKSLELDNTAVSGQILTSTVLLLRRETLEHVSVRGCKNVSLKYHLNPYLNVFGLQQEAAGEPGETKIGTPKMALKSLYTYRCRHHRRRPYLPSSLSRRDSDSEPTHELVTLCHKLGIWTDTAWCTTPGNRCYRRRNYLTMRVPNGTSEVWVVFDRLWRSKNWIGPTEDSTASRCRRDGRLWEQEEFASDGEPLGINQMETYREGKATPTHLRASHRRFVDNIHCDSCGESILERCEQCSVLMHCAGCRKTLCASCAFDRPYSFRKQINADNSSQNEIWWAPGYSISPSLIAEPAPPVAPNAVVPPFNLNFKWCCTQPVFSGGGGMSFPPAASRDSERIRATPLPKGQGWEDPEFSSLTSTSLSRMAAPPPIPGRMSEVDRTDILSWLLGPPGRKVIDCPRNLCHECYDSEAWKVHCKACSKPLCMEHDLRGLKLRICGFKELGLEKVAVREQAAKAKQSRMSEKAVQRTPVDGPITSAFQLGPLIPSATTFSSANDEPPLPASRSNDNSNSTAEASVSSTDLENSLRPPLHQPSPSRPFLPLPSSPSSSLLHGRPSSAGSASTITSRSSSPASVCQEQSDKASTTPYPASPVWSGCLSFFCPIFRIHGDMRPRCASQTSVKECAACSTFVCSTCIANVPPPFVYRDRDGGCKCTRCLNTFYCPNCQRKRVESGQCKRIEEEQKEKEELIRKAKLEAEERRQREKSDWVAGLAGDFWSRIINSEEDPAATTTTTIDEIFSSASLSSRNTIDDDQRRAEAEILEAALATATLADPTNIDQILGPPIQQLLPQLPHLLTTPAPPAVQGQQNHHHHHHEEDEDDDEGSDHTVGAGT